MNPTNEIKPHMPVVCSRGKQFAIVDHMDGDSVIKLARDDGGQHHYIPVSWVSSIDDKVHVDRPGDEAMRGWMTSAESAKAEERRIENSSAAEPKRVPNDDKHPELDPERAERLRRS
jgi:hypothetical protein